MAADADQLDQGVARRVSVAARSSHVVYGVLIAGILALFPTWVALGKLWIESADYQHGFLVAAIAIYWLVQIRGDIDAAEVAPLRLAILPLAGALLCWAIASRANSELMQQLLLPPIAVLSVMAILGWRVARVVAAPILFLYYVIPVWDHLVPLLQAMTTWTTEHLLALLGVPTVVDGNDVSIPAGRFTVADACSGKRYLIVGLTYATLLGKLQGLRGRRLIVLLLATIGAAFVINWLRVVTIIYAGHLTDMQHYLVAQEHLTFGWLVFIPLLAIITLVARRLERTGDNAGSPVVSRPAAVHSQRVPLIAVWPLTLFIAPVVLAAGHAGANVGQIELGHLPVLTGSWQGPFPSNGDWQPRYEAASAQRRGAYAAADGETVEVYVNAYGRQEQGRELIFVHNTLTPSPGWTAMPGQSHGEGLATFEALHAGQRWVLGQSFQVGGAVTESQALTQLQYGVRSLWHPVPSGTVAFASKCLPDCDQAELRLRTLWREEGAELMRLIPTHL